MIDHITFHVSDYETGKEFYTKALAPVGYTILADYKDYGIVGFGKDRPDFWIYAKKEKVGGQPHIAFRVSSKEEVHAFYEAALAAGGVDNGAPGNRPHYGPEYYGAFVLSPDGHNVEAVLGS